MAAGSFPNRDPSAFNTNSPSSPSGRTSARRVDPSHGRTAEVPVLFRLRNLQRTEPLATPNERVTHQVLTPTRCAVSVNRQVRMLLVRERIAITFIAIDACSSSIRLVRSCIAYASGFGQRPAAAENRTSGTESGCCWRESSLPSPSGRAVTQTDPRSHRNRSRMPTRRRKPCRSLLPTTHRPRRLRHPLLGCESITRRRRSESAVHRQPQLLPLSVNRLHGQFGRSPTRSARIARYFGGVQPWFLIVTIGASESESSSAD